MLCLHTLPDRAPLLGPQPIPTPIPAQSCAAHTTACQCCTLPCTPHPPLLVAAPEEMKRHRPLCALACAGERKGCVMSHVGVSGRWRGHCVAVEVVWTSWLVRNEGREMGSERGERRELRCRKTRVYMTNSRHVHVEFSFVNASPPIPHLFRHPSPSQRIIATPTRHHHPSTSAPRP